MTKSCKTPKRILYIQRPYGGGSSISLLELVKGLDKTKFTPIVIFYQDNAFRDCYEKAGIKVACVNEINAISRFKKTSGNSFLRSIKRYYTNSEIDLVCSKYNSDVAKNYDFINKVIIYNKKQFLVPVYYFFFY